MKSSHIGLAAVSTVWLLGEKVIVLGLSLLVAVLLARYLGPSGFGALSFAIATIAIVSAFSGLGLGGGTVVRELVEEPAAAGEIVGTALTLRLLASSALVPIALIIASAADVSHWSLVAIVALSLPLDSIATLRLVFEGRVSARPVASATIVSAVAGAALRLAAIYGQAELWIFAALVPAHALLTAAILMVISNQYGLPLRLLRFSPKRASNLMRDSWPLILSAAGAAVYLKLDQFMLGEMVGMSEVGLYAVAARLSEVWYVLPTVVGVSIAPRLIELRNSDAGRYELRLKQAFRYSFWLGTAVAIVVTLIATPLIVLLFGEDYRQAGDILSIHIWTCPAVFVGVVLQKWFLAERLLIHSFARHIFGAVLNVGLNLWLIPIWGGAGAAIGTLISYTFVSFLSCFVTKRTFNVGLWILDAIWSPQLMLPGARSRAN